MKVLYGWLSKITVPFGVLIIRVPYYFGDLGETPISRTTHVAMTNLANRPAQAVILLWVNISIGNRHTI